MRLPPLNALRAFEAAARHEGYIAAAEELHVTRGAVSRHIKLLEDHLGVQLFRRHAKGVALTEAGRNLQPVLERAFRDIVLGVERISRDAQELRILCPPATSLRWLMPRLDDFRTCHPDIRVRLTTDFHTLSGFDNTEYDIGFSVSKWPRNDARIAVETVFPVLMTPICTPAMAESLRASGPEGLADATLLHDTPRRTDWRDWLATYPVKGVSETSGDTFPNLDMAVKAAVMGAGVVMADLVLCRDELETGALVAPFPDLACKASYGDVCLVGERSRWEDPKVRLFRDWARKAAQPDVDRLHRA
ncbi:LysR substrate-binding domain-containing protein [Psychromarinibacter sp. S121]|uniref:LysR substrate-binding domain-containing protein n=1 Tax=Psychromarinibacter sp. S121 TaxID=3415127 RepID=UPI003C7AF236